MRIIPLCVSLILAATSSIANTFTVDELRSAVIARDFDAVRSGLNQAQQAFLDGKRPADDIRDLFIALSRSAPETVAFVEDWLARDPDNPKAQIARAWSLYEAARHVRSAGNGYSAQVANNMLTRTDVLASAAYSSEPYLIPASDALVRGVGRVRGADVHPLEVMHGVLMAHPNWGTVERAIISPHFGLATHGSKIAFCDGVATLFPIEEREKLSHRCKMRAAPIYRSPALVAYIEEHMWTDETPETAESRLSHFIGRGGIEYAPDAQIDWAIETLLTLPINQYQLVYFADMARRLENILYARPRPDGMVSHTFRKVRLAQTEAFLEHDPHNLDLLDLAEGVAFASDYELIVEPDGRSLWTSKQVVRTKDQKKARRAAENAQRYAFSLRRLQASPYDSDAWLDLARQVEQRNLPYSFFDSDMPYANMIFFSGDPLSSLSTFIHNKSVQWETMLLISGETSAQLKNMPAWSKFFETVNKEQQVICPLLRAQLLREDLCKKNPHRKEVCATNAWPRPVLTNTFIEVARNTVACAPLFEKSAEQLWYTPIPYDEIIAHIEGS